MPYIGKEKNKKNNFGRLPLVIAKCFFNVRQNDTRHTTYDIRHTTYKTGGYALMLSIVVSSIVLSIGLSLFNIVQKELILSATGRDSQFAFYSADGGIECALYWDIKQLALPANLAESQGDNSPTEPVHTGTECGETDFSGGGGVWEASISDGV